MTRTAVMPAAATALRESTAYACSCVMASTHIPATCLHGACYSQAPHRAARATAAGGRRRGCGCECSKELTSRRATRLRDAASPAFKARLSDDDVTDSGRGHHTTTEQRVALERMCRQPLLSPAVRLRARRRCCDHPLGRHFVSVMMDGRLLRVWARLLTHWSVCPHT
jgi:hypothetical protein